MSTSQIKAISLRATYESNLDGLKRDQAIIKSVRRQLEKDPIRIPVRLDLGSLRSEGTKAAEEFKKAFTASMATMKAPGFGPGGGVSAGGILVPAGAMAQMKQFSAAAGKEFKRMTTEADDGKTRVITSFKQMADGLVSVKRDLERKMKDGSTAKSGTTTVIDTRPIEKLKSMLDQLNRDFSGRLGSAKGSKGDVASVLTDQRDRLVHALASFGDLQGTPEFRRANKMIDTLDKQISQALPTQGRARAAADSKAFSGRADRLIAQHDRQAQASLKENKAQEEIARAIPERAQREAAVNQVLREREALFARQERHYERLTRLSNAKGYADPAARFENAGYRMGNLRNQIPLDRQRESSRSAAADQAAALERQVQAATTAYKVNRERLKSEEALAKQQPGQVQRALALNAIAEKRRDLHQQTQSAFGGLQDEAQRRGDHGLAGRLGTARRQAELDLERDTRLRPAAARNSARSAAADLERELQAASNNYKLARERLNTEEAIAKKIENQTQKEKALNQVLAKRVELLGNTGNAYSNIRSRATQRGASGVTNKVDQAEYRLGMEGERDMRRMEVATRNSGHALDFHTSSLLKNAGTFLKWYGPAQASMKTLAAIGSGFSGAITAQKDFKQLQNVFQGTREEAKQLAVQTLLLAAANGRSAEEAASAATQWARLGLTRVQILMATETSLRAANVAEVSAADATKYLTATYKGFGLAVADLPPLLDYLNSLSNRYNVTVGDLFQGMSRSAKVAREAGASYQELGAIIATVSDQTGRPGAEIGNSVKSILGRLRRPKITASLQDEFNVDTKTPEGDAKSATAVLSELAALYPKLSRLEKARLADLVAGSMQSNRFAVIVESYTDALIAQAKASFDVNSSQRESENLLSSVDAMLQRVTTSWTALFHAMGEAGAFDFLANNLKRVSYLLEDSAEGIDNLSHLNDGGGAKGKPAKFKVDRRSADMVDSIADPTGLKAIGRFASGAFLFRNPDEVNTDQIREAIANIQSGRYNNHWTQNGRKDQTLAYLQSFLSDGGSAGSAPGDLTKQVLQGQSRVGGLGAAQRAFQSIARDLTARRADPKKLLSQFDDATSLLSSLPGGMKNVGNARTQIRPLLESGRKDEAAKALNAVAGQFSSARQDAFLKVEEDRKKAVETTQKAIDETRKRGQDLYAALGTTTEADDQQRLSRQIDVTNGKLKEQEDTLKAISGVTLDLKLPTLSEGDEEAFNDYFKDLKAAADAFGSGFNTGLGSLDAKLRIGAGMFATNSIQQSITATRQQGAGTIATLQQGVDLYSNPDLRSRLSREQTQQADNQVTLLRQQLDYHQAIDDRLKSELEKTTKANEEAARSLELKRQVSVLQESFDNGGASASASAARFDVGRSEGEKLIARARGLIGATRTDLADPYTGLDGPQTAAREAGSMSSNLTATKSTLASLEERLYRATADRAQLEVNITEEARKQREETTKRLALASREDQLRTAAAAAALRQSGRSTYGMQEFQYFSQGTRNAIANYLPGGVTGLDDRQRDNNRSRGDLDQEINLIAVSLKTLREAFNEIRPGAENRVASLADPSRLFPSGADGKRIIDGNRDPAQFNLKLDQVNIDLQFDRFIPEITSQLQAHLDQRLDAALRNYRPSLSAPNTAPAAGTF